jgi:hypothetical protein
MDVDGMTGGGKGPPGPSTTAVAPAAGGAPHVRQVQTQSDSEQLRILIQKIWNRVWILRPLFIFEKDPNFGQKAIISELLQFYTRFRTLGHFRSGKVFF